MYYLLLLVIFIIIDINLLIFILLGLLDCDFLIHFNHLFILLFLVFLVFFLIYPSLNVVAVSYDVKAVHVFFHIVHEWRKELTIVVEYAVDGFPLEIV